jgi:hypothetical protein
MDPKTSTGASPEPVSIFVSYAREDAKWLDPGYRFNLVPFLADSLRRYSVTFWLDKGLKPGDEFMRHIEAGIDQAGIALLIVSQNFLNSEFIETREMSHIARRAAVGKMIVVPVLVEHCNWPDNPFLANWQMIPTSGPLIEYTESEPKWAKVRWQILDTLNLLIDRIRRAEGSEQALSDPEKRELDRRGGMGEEPVTALTPPVHPQTRGPSSGPRPSSSPKIEVFLSAKGEDYVEAARVYEYLTSQGINVFFGENSLPALGNSDYRDVIDNALDEAQHMVVVTSSRKNVESQWVKAEWGFFVNEKRANRKRGNLVTVAIGGLKPGDLPPSLRYYEVIESNPTGLERLTRYLVRRLPS